MADNTTAILNQNNDLKSSGASESGLVGFNSRPESPVSEVYGTTAQKNNHFYYSSGSLARRRKSPSVGRSVVEYYSLSKPTGINFLVIIKIFKTTDKKFFF